jgi:serine phosphatase RsbU (regulator of sigma subunit)
MLLRAGECRVLKVAGIPPGLFPEINYDHLTLQLEPGDSLLFLHGWFDRRAQLPTSRI